MTKIHPDDNPEAGAAPADPLQALATSVERTAPPLGDGVTDADVDARAQQQADAEQAQAMEAMEAAVVQGVHFGLCLVRKGIAKSLPEIQQTWTNEAMVHPARAALPLIRKHAGSLMETAAKSPELSILLVACLPLALGIVQAMELNRQNEAKRQQEQGGQANNVVPLRAAESE